MLFTPNYAVSYKGNFYRACEQFEIDEADAAAMSKHGSVIQSEPPADNEPPQDENPLAENEPPKKPNRKGKGAEQ